MELPFLLSLLFLSSSLLVHHASTALLLPPNAQKKPTGEDHDDVALGRPRTEIFHQSTGLCVLRKSLTDPLKLGLCSQSDAWNYTPQKFLIVRGTYFCLQAVGSGQPVRLSIICTPEDSQWKMVSDSNKETHLSTKLTDRTIVCLDIDSDYTVISNPCTSVDSQWFKIITGYNKVTSGSGLPLM